MNSKPKKRSFLKRSVHRVASWIVVALIQILSLLPLSAIRLLGKGMGTLFYWLPSHARFLAQCNLRAVYPQLSEQEHKKLLKATLQHNAQSILELGAMWRWPKEKVENSVREVKGQELLDAAYAKGKGVLLLGPHIGNWEVAGSYISMNYPSTIMYRPPNLQGLEKSMRAARTRFGATLVPTDLRGIRQIIKALKENQLSAILPDQDAGKNGVHAPFMGVPARTMTLVSKLLQKSEAECLYLIALRHPQSGFVLHILPADRQALAAEDPLAAASALNQGIETCIRLAPEQYLWTYRRFRGQPEGAPNIYRKR
ncbi:lysophospholipid acyltransferase family protein [Thiomicrorhabdus sp. 6S3-12]|uniref:lysophospholipid acyltransferase family protein n=1 Tax=Thiomicrorhabdus sp. 6S3-12 TaxID=2819681 RepID=UPI001AAC7854|nr:lysophospholipid acyltransferase family protein [Thiomicrorhabdus sp. 6S3-12]MBO1924733.1 lysophospholipid acyltransferase family protein [Thiomicrorhabdus sp. 6S3-12]